MRRWSSSIGPALRFPVVAVFLYAFGVATLVAAVFPTNPVWTSPGEPVGLPSVRTWSRSAAPAASSGTGTLRLSPQDTYLNVDSTNYSTATTIRTRTFPDYMPASAALMTFDLSALPQGVVVQTATLHVALVEADRKSGTTYNVSAQKVLGRNPVVARATGYTSDGVTAWSPSTCCAEGAPLAQADLSPPYDTRAVNKTPGLKSWTMTAMVQEWRANPATNFGVVLNADATKPKNRYRYFASMEHPDPNLRPYLEVTFQAGDATPPTAAITAPGPGAILSNTVTLFATAQDNVGVAGVQFQLDGVPLGAERTAAPYNLTLDTTTLSDGNYVLTAVARDAAGNAASSPGVPVTVNNGTLLLEPEDTYLNLDTTNYSDAPLLSTYTWPAYSVGNAILMKFNLSALPSGAQVDEATLYLSLVDRDATPETSYTVSAHKVLNRNPLLAGATGSTFDGATSWTPSSCCYNGVPMAQSDISNAYDQRAIDKTLGFKTWTLTTMVEEWLANPGSNFGLLLNSDPTKPADRYRFFASMEHSDASLRPYLRVKFRTGGPPADTTPPTVSMTAPASGASVSGSVNVSAAATDNVGVTSVQFQLDGANVGAADTTAPYSTSWNTTTTTNGSHTLTAVARDAAGNSTTSVPVTVTVSNPVSDTIPPTVSMTAPAGGSTVSGNVNVTATASDNVGVSSVQFQLDGANLGAADTTSPYVISWNTTSVSDGSHTLRAVARDAAGNSTISAAVSLTVSNAAPPPPPPPSGSIASRFPGDVGIETDSNVVFVERFDQSVLSTLFSRWTDILNGSAMSFSTDAPAGSPVPTSLSIPWSAASAGGHLYKQIAGVNDTLHVRYYVKYPTSGSYQHEGVWMGGYNPPLSWPNPQAGVKPTGSDRFSASAEQSDNLTRFDHYNYWMNMRADGSGTYWGNTLLNNAGVRATPGQWMCVEHMVKLNNPVSSFNGEHAIWINGVKVSHLGQGFPNGYWNGGNFTQDPGGAPFEGFRWRSDANLNLNWIWLQVYAPGGGSGNIKYAHVVAAKSYIGCLSPGSGSSPGDTTPPSVSITSPAAGATVSGSSVIVSANASDNVGVAGVQFKLDGVNLGSEDTTAPYSISWNTTATANGSHALTVVARDAAGNQATSPSMNVTVNNGTGSGGGSALFSSNWDTAVGTAASAVTDGGRWPNYWEFNGGSGVQLLSVVSGGPNGHNALRVQQRGSSFAANVQVDNIVPPGSDYYVRFYMRNDDTSNSGDHIVTVDTWNYSNLTYLRKYGGPVSYDWVLSLYGCGYTYPIGHWGPGVPLLNGRWYRFEYYVHYTDATHVQVHPRVYDDTGVLILSDANFLQSDFGGTTWNGRNDWTLASYYAAGHSFCVDPGWMRTFGLGNNGQFGAADTGLYWYFGGVEIRTDRWPGPVQ